MLRPRICEGLDLDRIGECLVGSAFNWDDEPHDYEGEKTLDSGGWSNQKDNADVLVRAW